VYIPAHFALAEQRATLDLIEAYPFGTLVVLNEGQLNATHLPFLVARDAGPHGTLRGHIARANPAWRGFDGKTDALVIFLGPHGYISPDWYRSPAQVPTWNYAAVHAYGVPQLLDDGATVALLDSLSARFEEPLRPKPPWTSAKLDPQGFARLRHGIVAFEIPLRRLEGKLKLSQNKTAADVAGAAEALRTSRSEREHALADLMELHGPKPHSDA
jgi:transcriptional regulator